MEYLFEVIQTFIVRDRGLVLVGGPRTRDIPFKSRIRLVLPDKAEIDTEVLGEGTYENFAIMIDETVQKEQVPLGTEVWLYD